MYTEWITSFDDKELHAPFVIEKDSDYYDDLRKRLSHFVKSLEKVSADAESVKIAINYSNKVCEAIRHYYKGRIGSCHQKIENLIAKCNGHELALAELSKSYAFPGTKGSELQLFRGRSIAEAKTLKQKDMLHLPFSLRSKSGNYRFSIPGVISLYLANSSYGCWLEMGRPSEHDFYVAPVVLDGKQRIFNLAVMTRDLGNLNGFEKSYVQCWLKLLILMIATSYKVEEKNRTFRSECIISQSVMLACKKLGYDGVAYYSKQVEDERFGFCAINVALFAEYIKGREYGDICNHLKVDESLNYQLFRQLKPVATYERYSLRVDRTEYITNINGYKRQYKYNETEFFRFDEHLFGRWTNKNIIEWGNALEIEDLTSNC